MTVAYDITQWQEMHCGACDTGSFTETMYREITCMQCGHTLDRSELVDVDEWKTVNGVIVVRMFDF